MFYRQAALSLLAFSALLASCQSSLGATRGNETVASPAIWREQDLTLVYHGTGRLLESDTVYHCDELERLVLALLRAVGARANVRHEGERCVDFASPQTLRLLVASPFEATPENIEAATTHDATQRLLAQLHGKSLPTVTDLERLSASWQKVSLRRVGRMTLEPGNCLLVKAVRDQLFRKLSVRYTTEPFRCNAAVEALVSTQPVPPARTHW